MKFAIPASKGRSCRYFAYCDAFAFIDVDERKIIMNEIRVTPQPHGTRVFDALGCTAGCQLRNCRRDGVRTQQLFEDRSAQVATGANTRNH